MSEIEVYSLLADPEGWSLRPWEIARLTDWQIENLYLRPMRKKAEERDSQPTPSGQPVGQARQTVRSDSQPTKEQYVRHSMAMFGGTRGKWEKVWDRFQEQDRQARGGQ